MTVLSCFKCCWPSAYEALPQETIMDSIATPGSASRREEALLAPTAATIQTISPRKEATVTTATAPVLEGISSVALSTSSSSSTTTPAAPPVLEGISSVALSASSSSSTTIPAAASLRSVRTLTPSAQSSSSSSSLSIAERSSSLRLTQAFFGGDQSKLNGYRGIVLWFCSKETINHYKRVNRGCNVAVSIAPPTIHHMRLIAQCDPTRRSGVTIDSLEKFRSLLNTSWNGMLSSCSTLTSIYCVGPTFSVARPSLYSVALRTLDGPQVPEHDAASAGHDAASAVVEALVTNCPRLTHMSFPSYWSKQIPAVIDLIRNSPNLTSINLSQLEIHSESDWQAVADALRESGPRITKLCCHYTYLRQKFQTLVNACPYLESANFQFCGLDDTCARVLAEGCRKLTKIDLGFNQLSPVGLEVVAKGLPNLTDLDCSGIKGLTKANSRKIFPALAKLKKITCKHCNIRDPILGIIVKHCRKHDLQVPYIITE